MMLLFVLGTMTSGQVDPQQAAITYAYRRHVMTLLTEGAGLFWVFAELVILFLVIPISERLCENPINTALVPTRGELQRIIVWTAAFVIATFAVFGRHLIWPPAYVLLANPAIALEQFSAILLVRERTHLALWTGFVTLWVLLEILIVCYGIRSYRRLRELLGIRNPESSSPMNSAAALLLAVGCALGVSMVSQGLEPETVRETLHAADAANAPFRNALYLYLRIAGVVWIVVEWIAAVFLWKGYRLLGTTAQARGIAP